MLHSQKHYWHSRATKNKPGKRFMFGFECQRLRPDPLWFSKKGKQIKDGPVTQCENGPRADRILRSKGFYTHNYRGNRS